MGQQHPRSHLRAELTDKSGSYQGVDHLIALQNRFHCRKNILAGYQLFRLTGVNTGRTAYTVLINRKLPVASYFNCVKQTAGLTFRRFARIAAAIAYLPNHRVFARVEQAVQFALRSVFCLFPDKFFIQFPKRRHNHSSFPIVIPKEGLPYPFSKERAEEAPESWLLPLTDRLIAQTFWLCKA